MIITIFLVTLLRFVTYVTMMQQSKGLWRTQSLQIEFKDYDVLSSYSGCYNKIEEVKSQ